MEIREIVFTEKNVARLLHSIDSIPDNETYVVVKTAVSTISSGTERANITADTAVPVL